MSGLLGVRNALMGASTDFDSDTGAVSEPLLMARCGVAKRPPHATSGAENQNIEGGGIEG